MHSRGNHKQNEKTIHRMGENTASDVTNKGLIPNTQKQFMKLSVKKKKANNPIKKWAEDLNKYISEENI